MSIFLTVIHIIVCFVLIAVILLQAGRGQGFGGTFGGGEGTQTIFGTRSADFLSKATSVCAILFLFTCIGLDVIEARKGRSLFETSPKLETEDLKALQEALKELEAKEAEQKKSESEVTEEALKKVPQVAAATVETVGSTVEAKEGEIKTEIQPSQSPASEQAVAKQ